MFGHRISVGRRSREEAEKPFWISFADLMTALMVLFLLVMSVALLAVTRKATEREQQEAKREKEIAELVRRIEQVVEAEDGLNFRSPNVIDFGQQARFDTASYTLQPAQEQYLRSFVPKVLNVARDDIGQRWLKRIVVEGFTDRRGTYLYNLNLSLQRSQRVLCALMAPPISGENPMTRQDLEDIRRLFLVGGYSSNSAKGSLEASRRIELRLEFYGVSEKILEAPEFAGEAGACRL